MLKKWGKFYARWTGLDGKRKSKACRTLSAARRVQQQETAKVTALKKAAAPRTPSRKSPRCGPRKRHRATTAQ